MKELEEIYGFKLCIHYRDFGFGDIADVIVDNISRSRCTIVILSNDAVQRPWVGFELNVAFNQSVRLGKHFIIVKLGEINMQLVSSFVKEMLESRVYIEFPETTNKPLANEQLNKILTAKRTLFWVKLSNILYGKSAGASVCCNLRLRNNYRIIDDSTAMQHYEEGF
jgi:hypothetical protein